MENNSSKKIYEILSKAKDICTTEPNKSYMMSREAYDMSKGGSLKSEEGYSLIGMALACRASSEINKMLDYSYNALEIFEVLQDNLGKIRSLNLIGIAYFYNSMYEEALKHLLRCLDLFEEYKDDYLLSCVLNNIGEVFRESVKYEEALEYYHKSLKICEDINLRLNTASLLSNIGEIYFIENNYNEALKYYTKSYDILINEKNMITLGEVENNLGKIYYINNDYNKAEEYFFRALKRLDNIDNKFYAIDVLVNIAKMKAEKDPNMSLYYFEKAIQYAEKTNAKKKLSQVCKTVSDYYEKTGNTRYALEYFKKYHNVEQEIAVSVVGNKLEILKIELEHSKEHHNFEKIKTLNRRLGMEILNQNKELKKIQKLNETLEKKSLEDELTGIPNRRHINLYLNKVWDECLLHDETIALFIIDIDNFKKYNDYWGHLKGDECLIKVVNCMKDIQVRRKDFLGRYGGEEFIYYTKDINYSQALELGNLIRTEVEKLCLKSTLDDKSKVVTISVGGVLGKSSNFSNIADMIQIADEELYKAKDMGRNTTSINNNGEFPNEQLKDKNEES